MRLPNPSTVLIARSYAGCRTRRACCPRGARPGLDAGGGSVGGRTAGVAAAAGHREDGDNGDVDGECSRSTHDCLTQSRPGWLHGSVYDVVIVGGGIAGLAAAHALPPGCRVLLLEASPE